MKSLLLISLLFSLNSFGAIVYTEQPGIYKKYISSNKTVKYKLVQSNASSEACKFQAEKACHPAWGSLPIANLQVVNQCAYYHITTGTDENGNLLYTIGSQFDGTQVKDNLFLCPKGL